LFLIHLVKAQVLTQIRHEIGHKILNRSLVGSQEDMNSYTEMIQRKAKEAKRKARIERKQQRQLQKL